MYRNLTAILIIAIAWIIVNCPGVDADMDFSELVEENDTYNLLITDQNQINNMKTITYVYSNDKKAIMSLLYNIKKIAKKLGKSNGLLILDINSDSYLNMKGACHIQNISPPIVVFEVRDEKKHKCIVFDLLEKEKIIDVLMLILENIDKQNDIENKKCVHDLNNITFEFLKSKGMSISMNNSLLSFREFVYDSLCEFGK